MCNHLYGKTILFIYRLITQDLLTYYNVSKRLAKIHTRLMYLLFLSLFFVQAVAFHLSFRIVQDQAASIWGLAQGGQL